jgi:hypothetical protein
MGPNGTEHLMMATLAGLTMYEIGRGNETETVWVSAGSNAIADAQFSVFLDEHPMVEDRPETNSWTLVNYFRNRGTVKGYILCDRVTNPISAGVAVSLAPVLGGVVIEPDFVADAQAIGLTQLADVRTRDEAWVFANYKNQKSNKALAYQPFDIIGPMGLYVALNCFVMDGHTTGTLNDEVLQWMEPDSPVLGTIAGVDEGLQVGRAGSYGLFSAGGVLTKGTELLGLTNPKLGTQAILSDNWLETTHWRAFRSSPANHASYRDLTWEDNVHYVTVQLSDGDNLEWVGQSAFYSDQNFWASPSRGSMPFGWGMPPLGLHDLLPQSLKSFCRDQRPADSFTAYGDGGYHYPDKFAENRGVTRETIRRQHTQRMAPIYQRTGLNVLLNIMWDWDNADAFKAYYNMGHDYQRLLGLLSLQYVPYAIGTGAIAWTTDTQGNDLPITSFRYHWWNKSGASFHQPIKTADLITSNAVHTGSVSSQDNFSAVIAVAWEYFRNERDNERTVAGDETQANVGRGFAPVLWFRNYLPTWARVLTPEQYLMMIRLRLRTDQTLARYREHLNTGLTNLDDAGFQAYEPASALRQTATQKLGQAQSATDKAAFDLCREAETAMEQARLNYLKASLIGNKITLKSPKPMPPLFYFDISELDADAPTVAYYRVQQCESADFSTTVTDDVTSIGLIQRRGAYVRVKAIGWRGGDESAWMNLNLTPNQSNVFMKEDFERFGANASIEADANWETALGGNGGLVLTYDDQIFRSDAVEVDSANGGTRSARIEGLWQSGAEVTNPADGNFGQMTEMIAYPWVPDTATSYTMSFDIKQGNWADPYLNRLLIIVYGDNDTAMWNTDIRGDSGAVHWTRSATGTWTQTLTEFPINVSNWRNLAYQVNTGSSATLKILINGSVIRTVSDFGPFGEQHIRKIGMRLWVNGATQGTTSGAIRVWLDNLTIESDPLPTTAVSHSFSWYE